MNGIQIDQVFISGVMIGFLYHDEEEYKSILISFFIIGIRIVWW